jgi:hypothetical protein
LARRPLCGALLQSALLQSALLQSALLHRTLLPHGPPPLGTALCNTLAIFPPVRSISGSVVYNFSRSRKALQSPPPWPLRKQLMKQPLMNKPLMNKPRAVARKPR